MVRPIAPTTDPSPLMPPTRAVCPYLMAGDGAWRASTPARDHRCTAVTPAAILAPEKQRRLCLVADHLGCATYRAAIHRSGDPDGSGDLAVDGSAAVGARTHARAIARTTPLVLDHGRVAVSVPALRGERGFGQIALMAMMALAFAAILLARLSAGDGDGDGAPGIVVGAASPSPATAPSNTPIASAGPAVAETGAPVRTLVPTEVDPTAPVASPAASAEPSGSSATYKVRSGDTLSGIAAEFGTTWQTLAKLNGIDDPGRLKVGQVLDLP